MSPEENDVPHIAYYISDYAYNQLVYMAQKQGYIPWNTIRAKGMSNFLNDLASYPLEDTRPIHTKNRHEEEIRNNRAPTWTNRSKRGRLIRLTDDSLQSYVEAALKFGIIREDPYPVGGPDRRTPYPTVGCVLEAIGLGWLTPQNLPKR